MRGLLTELKRRNVYKVAVVYAAAAWMMLEAADLIAPHLGLPEWTVSLVLLLSALGFPVAIVLAWAFDLTPEGVIRTQPVAAEEHHPLSGMRIIEFAVIGMLVVTVGFLYFERFSVHRYKDAEETGEAAGARAPVVKQTRSIAVLPFVNMSGDKENEYFSDGIAEELINMLTRVPNLRVVARTSAFAFKGKNEDIRAIGEKLDVGTILEGSVRKADGRLRITAQLINVADGYHLWSNSYDREMTDIFAIQDEIATAIVDALRGQLGIDPVAFTQSGTENIEAYNFYLQARYFFHQGGIKAWPKAIEFYQRAAAVDPNYADAYAGMSLVYDLLDVFTRQLTLEHKELADQALERALLLDPGHSEALTGKAVRLVLSSKDWQGAENLFKLAQRGAGDRTQAYLVYANSLLIPTGRVDEALAIVEKLERNDPLNSRIKMNYASNMLFGNFEIERVIAKLEEAVALDPELPLTSYVLTLVYIQSANLASAEKQIAHLATLLPPSNILLLDAQGMLQLAKRQPETARETMARMISLATESGGPYRPIASLAAALGEFEECIKWSEQAAENGELGGLYLRSYRRSSELWENPRFQDLLKKIKLDDESLREMGYLE